MVLKLPTLFGHKVSKGYSRNPLTLTDCNRMLITTPVFAIIGLALNLQTAVAQATLPPRNDSGQTRSRVVAAPTDTSATAVRADGSINIDGKADEAAWQKIGRASCRERV